VLRRFAVVGPALAPGAGKLAAAYANNRLHVVDLASGANTTYPGGQDALLGGAQPVFVGTA
jgi:hypothetical protein